MQGISTASAPPRRVRRGIPSAFEWIVPHREKSTLPGPRRPHLAGKSRQNVQAILRRRRQLPGRLRLRRSEEHTSELQSRTLISYAVFCLKKKKKKNIIHYMLGALLL